MKTRNTVLKLIALLTFVTMGTAWAANPASDPASAQITESTGMFGITHSQTARINVARVEDGNIGTPDIRVELSFVDGDGNILSQKVIDVSAGKSAFLDLRGGDVPRTDANRTQLRAVVRYVGTPDTRTYMWAPTLEVFDNESGETRFLLPAVQKVLDPAVR